MTDISHAGPIWPLDHKIEEPPQVRHAQTAQTATEPQAMPTGAKKQPVGQVARDPLWQDDRGVAGTLDE